MQVLPQPTPPSPYPSWLLGLKIPWDGIARCLLVQELFLLGQIFLLFVKGLNDLVGVLYKRLIVDP